MRHLQIGCQLLYRNNFDKSLEYVDVVDIVLSIDNGSTSITIYARTENDLIVFGDLSKFALEEYTMSSEFDQAAHAEQLAAKLSLNHD